MKAPLVFMLLFVWLSAYSGDTIVVSNPMQIMGIGQQVEYYIDSTCSISGDSVVSGMDYSRFRKLPDDVNTFPHIAHPIWFRAIVRNENDDLPYLEIGEPSVNFISLYQVSESGAYKVRQLGNALPFASRDILVNNFLIRLDIPIGATQEYLIKVDLRHQETITIPLYVGTLTAFYERSHRYDLLKGIIYGAIIIVVLFNLIMYFTVYDRSYLYFALHASLAALWVINYYGNAFEFLWPGSPELNQLTPAITATSSLFVILFSRIFLKSAEYAPRMHRGLWWLISALLLVVVLNLADFFYESIVLIEISAVVMCTYLIALAIVVYSKGYTPALYYILALFSFFAGIILFVLQINGVVEATFLSRNSIPVGLGLELAAISLAQANRLRFYSREKRRAQLSLIESFKQNERLLLEQRDLLETKLRQQNIIETMRSRISQDIHDDLSSDLTRITWLAESLKSEYRSDGNEKFNSQLERIADNTRSTILKIREIIWAVNPDYDDLESLLSYIREYMVNYLEDTDIKSELKVPGDLRNRPISPEFKRNVFLIIKEAITNCVKHAQAKAFRVEVNEQSDFFSIVIEDNGVGFEGSGGSGNGLKNMERRMRSLQGELEIRQVSPSGTRIMLTKLTGR